MRKETFSRTELLIGEDGLSCLWQAKVAVFGLGGVGGYAAEALVRSGIGHFLLVDNDVISKSNLNRQIIALYSTIGQYKTKAMKARMADICPEAEVETRECFFLPENQDTFSFEEYDYVVDAIDTVSGKLALAECCQRAGTPLISAMGAGNKLDPSGFEVTDIYRTNVCPLARVMRRELRKRGIQSLKVVYSTEEAQTPKVQLRPEGSGKVTPGSMAFVPGAAGLLLASQVVKDLLERVQPFGKSEA
ncbi:MAG: tRNA threonylcarbamoyladenosine dehydratase [Lachnospiraceae bacterium]|nr:tRNA threonylcarbamoyladenosine dehydratase [Lachnospiraceae bacterium]